MKKRFTGIVLTVLLVLSIIVLPAPKVHAASEMKVSDALIDVLKKQEGFSATPYWDNGHWSVGYGTTCPSDKVEYYKKHGITQAEALELLAKYVARFENAVNSFANKHGRSFNQHEFDALVSFSYNCGEAWTSDLDGYFNTSVRMNGTKNDVIYGFCLYSTSAGEYVLVKRRLFEANMYLYGIYDSGNGSPDVKYVYLDGNGGDLRHSICSYDASQNGQINAAFTRIPTGVDAQGNPFIYTLEGWYTEDGVKVEKLDSSLKNGQVLYAKWADPEGTIVEHPKGKTVNQKVTVVSGGVNVRKGPATFYAKTGFFSGGTVVTVTEVYETGDYTWGKTETGWFRLDYSNYVDQEEVTFPVNGTVTGDDVNVRSGPGTSYSKVGKKNKGDRVTITEEATGGSYRWGKMTDGNWICLDYVKYDVDGKAISGISMVRPPYKTEYVQKSESLRLEGALVQIEYSDGSTSAMNLTYYNVSGFSNETLGEVTVKVTYDGHSTSFQVTIIKATVTFLDWDGTVLSSEQYAYGETVTPPPDPYRAGDGTYNYVFCGWDKDIEPCAGNTVYTATYAQTTDPVPEPEPTPDPDPEPTPDPEPDPEPTPDPDPEPTPDPEPDPEPTPDPDPEPTPDPDPEPDPDPTPDPEPDPDPEAPTHITSSVYTIENGIICGISAGTTVQTLLEGIDQQAYVTVYKEDQALSGDTVLCTGMTVQLVYGGNTIETLTVVVTGDLDGEGAIDNKDVEYLLWYTLFPDSYPLFAAADFNGDGSVDNKDVEYLLWYTLFPDSYPLT